VIDMKLFMSFIKIIGLIILVYISSILFNSSIAEVLLIVAAWVFMMTVEKHSSLINDQEQLLDAHSTDISRLKRKEKDSDIAILNLEERLKSLEQKRH
tara:strand:+ start:2894 stop:3187 length:294 start_codon:yes stop_codon:yes gene_type:complete